VRSHRNTSVSLLPQRIRRVDESMVTHLISTLGGDLYKPTLAVFSMLLPPASISNLSCALPPLSFSTCCVSLPVLLSRTNLSGSPSLRSRRRGTEIAGEERKNNQWKIHVPIGEEEIHPLFLLSDFDSNLVQTMESKLQPFCSVHTVIVWAVFREL
jgi:hypothetical protein